MAWNTISILRLVLPHLQRDDGAVMVLDDAESAVDGR